MKRLDFLRIIAIAMAAPKILVNKEPDLVMVADAIYMASGDQLTIYLPKGRKMDKSKVFVYASEDGQSWTRVGGEARDNELNIRCRSRASYKVYTTPYSPDNSCWSLNN